MSRIGYKKIDLPENVNVTVEGNKITVTGPLGTLSRDFQSCVSVKVEDRILSVDRADDKKESKQLHGTTRALINGMVEGVSKGFKKRLEIKGIGYRAAMQGNKLVLNVGFSHQVNIETVPGVKIEVPSATEVEVSGIDKQAVGQVAANIRAVKKPEPYAGKGIRYTGEHVLHKEGKKAGKK